MESHGGYLMRVEGLDPAELVELARRALPLDGVPDTSDTGLHVSLIQNRKIVRLGYDGAFSYGRRGARWYETHHALARLASRSFGTVVHAYVYDADEMEMVTSYASGARVGGERLYVADFEMPGDEDDFDDLSFEKMKESWPLGHLARVYGVLRDELVRMPKYATGVLLDLEMPAQTDMELLEALLAPAQRAVGT